MANSTDVYWDINGVSLQTLGWNISTWGGDLQAPPPSRGEDVTIPYLPGQKLMARMPDARTLTFNMWVQGSDSNGRVPTSATQRAEFEKNFKMLRDLFWNGGKPIKIARRWKEYGSDTVVRAFANGVYVNGFAPAMTGSARATFTAEIRLADPFFYGNEETITFTGTSPQSKTVEIKGDYETSDIVIEMTGSRYFPRVTNATEGIYVAFNDEIFNADVVKLDVKNWTATYTDTSESTTRNDIRHVSYSGHNNWMSFSPGTRTITITSTSGSALVTITYRPKYL